jgi:tripartite motif-containing protein 71
MKRVLILATAAALAAAAWASPPEYVYEGQWGKSGTGDGEFNGPSGVAAAPNGNVYVTDRYNNRVQYFTAAGSFLGKWGGPGSREGEFAQPTGVKVAPDRNVYVCDAFNDRMQYFTPAGSFLGSWGGLNRPFDLEIAPNGTVYVVDQYNYRCQFYTSAGSWLGSWPLATGYTTGIGRAANGNLYFVNYTFHYVYYCHPTTGSRLGSWGSYGSGNGQFDTPTRVEAGPDGYIYVGDGSGVNDRVQCFTATGSYVGQWGKSGTGNGEFQTPIDIFFVSAGARCYVSDLYNHRIQYFRLANPTVTPTSLGRVKALFK